MDEITCAVSAKKCKLSENSKTHKLLLQYQDMFGIVRKLTEADCNRSWKLHLYAAHDCLPILAAAGHPIYLKSVYLYLQKMNTLDAEYHEEYQKVIGH